MSTTSSIKTVNPTTGQVEKVFDEMSETQIDQIIAQADNTYREWSHTSFAERAKLFRNIANIIVERKQDLARLCAIEMGKLLKHGLAELQTCADIFNYYADNGEKFMADKPLETPHGKAYIAYQPIGVILCIEPWNFPFYQVIRVVASTVMAGNTVVVKHSSNVPQCGAMIEKLFADAGFPKGVYTNIFVPGAKASPLVTDPRIKGAALTGSEPAGISLATEAAKKVKKITLELGGSDPFIVLPDADLDLAVSQAAHGRLVIAGQVCTSNKRVIVMDKVADEFIAKAKAIYEKVKIGNPLDADTELTPLSSEKAVEGVLKQVDKAIAQGAKLVYGGKRINRPGAFMEPTILTDITPDMDIYHEEVFGPVLCIYRVKDVAAAIDLANATDFGLSAAIFATDTDAAEDVARKVQSGMVYINHTSSHAPELPFGGTKSSGYGHELSELGIHEFVNQKLIRVTTPDKPY